MTDKGAFITLEGIDGCGKSTQAELLCTWISDTLGDTKAMRTFEPGGWSGGGLLRSLLLGETIFTSRTELLFFLADRSAHLDTEISPALQRGQWIVCERYTDSTLAYQSWGRGIPFEEVDALLNLCRFPVPDLTVFLEIDEKTANSRLKQRGRKDRIEAEGDNFMARVAYGYKKLAERDSERIVVVNAALGVEQVAQHIREAVKQRLAERLPQKKFNSDKPCALPAQKEQA